MLILLIKSNGVLTIFVLANQFLGFIWYLNFVNLKKIIYLWCDLHLSALLDLIYRTQNNFISFDNNFGFLYSAE